MEGSFFVLKIFLFQNFSIKYFPLPLPSKKIPFGYFFVLVHYLLNKISASVAQLARAADL